MPLVDVEQRAEHEPHRVERLHEPFEADVIERGTLLQNGHHLLDAVAARREQFVAHEPLVLGFLLGMVGKSERGPVAIEAIKKHKSAYLMAVGGAAYLVAKAIKGAKVVGFADLGMEAIYEFDVKDMPVTVAVDAQGVSVHQTGPAEWQAKIAGIPVVSV